ncbi:TonB family protein [Hymenobacter sp. 5317J-9]|uniref:energy transducer TonB n=1 Tax=Hymenobacter sp. 5317J-9 TaxID=2932250 RepID=UPI001FD69B68|nr:energy transducer TonB [Hymenobacter sp. 5317J-9]UOQ95973.1 TonB family protein [Hymenobacter sp. 5317J-9]
MLFCLPINALRFSCLLALATCFFALVCPAVAQQSPVDAVAKTATVPATKTLYFDAQGRQIASAEGADHREDVIYRDSVGGTVRVYYPSGKLRRVVPYVHFAYGIKYGSETSFYETGELKSRCDYKGEGPVGYYQQYYRSGNVRYRTPLGKDLPKDAKGGAFGPDGQALTDAYSKEHLKMPTMRGGGGSAAIVQAVQLAVRYPVEALRSQITGKVFVGFMVDDCGFVRDVRIVKSPSPVFNATVMAAVASLGRLTPGEYDGETADLFFTVPITFTIR